jgi:glycosyltransferase involved in cell wall biosynthesis
VTSFNGHLSQRQQQVHEPAQIDGQIIPVQHPLASRQAHLLPTLLESFSGSYLEAMHFGTPILTSDRDFAREVCGEAALYFDPDSPSSIRDAILKLKNDPALGEQMVQVGGQRVARQSPTWDQIAENLLVRLGELAARAQQTSLR